MDHFQYRAGHLHVEQTPARELAERFGTPLYAYSKATLIEHFDRIQAAFARVDPLICYSVKSCGNTHICALLAQRGAGFDVVSGGELHRALAAGGDPGKIVFAGVGKTEREMREGLAAGIGWFNIESEGELGRLAEVAADVGVAPRCALRVNPDVDPQTHRYTNTGKRDTKFGVDLERAAAVFARFGRDARVRLSGLHLHIGSPVNDIGFYEESIGRGLGLADQLTRDGFTIDTLDIGGGFGAFYAGDEAPPAVAYAERIVPLLADRGWRIILEPGRAISANAGILLTRVLYVKDGGDRRFVIVDASMNELIRPALYGAYHFIWPVAAGDRVPAQRGADQPFANLVLSDVVGPVCESGDFLAQQRRLPDVQPGDLLAVFSCGAYAMSMASQYNSRPRAAEVLVHDDSSRLIRRRETYDDLVAAERV